MRTSSGICVMQHPSSGMSVIMNVSITKKLDGSSIRTGIIRKKPIKRDLWYKQLPSQTAQEVCKLLDKAWKSFYALKRSGGIETPRPPRFKQESIPITYMQMGIVHERDTDRVRLSLPKALKKYMEETYQIHENFLYLENKIFRGMDQIKQLRIYPPEKGNCKIIVVYEVPDQEELPQNGHELSIDLGLHNLMTCYDSENGKTFILGRKYLELERYFHKEIARVQAQWYGQQSGKGVKHPVTSKHIRKLYKRKQDSVNGLSAQDHKNICRILPGTGDHLCRYRGYPEHSERKRPGTQDKPEASQPAV